MKASAPPQTPRDQQTRVELSCGVNQFLYLAAELLDDHRCGDRSSLSRTEFTDRNQTRSVAIRRTESDLRGHDDFAHLDGDLFSLLLAEEVHSCEPVVGDFGNLGQFALEVGR